MTDQDQLLAFTLNGGATGARIRARDWSGHPLGPLPHWPSALRTTLGIVLGSSFPTFLAWGDANYLFHNDAYLPMLGKRADSTLGLPYQEVWSEVWSDLGPYVARVMAGESFFFENYATTLYRNGVPEQTWFTFSFSPVRDETGIVRGLLCTVIEVTDKVLALARHKEAEERLALSLEASGNIGTWSVDLDTSLTYVDERFARLFQVDAAAARSGTDLARFTGMIHPDDRPAVLAAIEHAIATGTLYDIEYRIPQRSGADVWVNARGKLFGPATSTGTERRSFAGIAVDITERKVAEQRRIASERLAAEASERAAETMRRLDVLLDAAPVGIAYVDMGGRLLVANSYNRVIWGDHPMPADVDGYGGWRGWWPEDSAHAGRRVAVTEWPVSRVLDGEEAAGGVFEIEAFGAPGSRKTILVRAAVIRNDAGVAVGAVAANMDISAQVAAERAMKDSETRFRLMADDIPQIVWAANADGDNDYVNTRWFEYTGEALPRRQDWDWRPHIHPDDLPLLEETWRTSLATGRRFEIEHRLRHHSGQFRWVLNRAVPSTDAIGPDTRWLGTLTDIHDKKTGEEELRTQSRRKDEFLAMLAHELRNPLAPISTAAHLLSLGRLDAASAQRTSEVIVRQVRHMTSLVDDLLDVSRVTRGLVELDLGTVDLPSVLASAIEQVRPLVDARGHALAVDADSALPLVKGDRVRLVQIVTNLLNNAAKYTPPGGSIGVSVAAAAGSVTIAVRDNGVGIAAHVLPHVFELFTQAERTPDRSQGGLGIGLALVQSLVQLHGGTVAASSAGLGQGSTFTVTLPAIGADHARAA
ncbi:PAS domain-containing protein [Pseudoduganella sp. SL102]|uniref:PAS domain-containing sensor histidine kinase n=1 Tax=Pseudoduganella sp. SL102 TaxID=2995154 RepID=UPI00248C4E45|nr:PAS domain-containing sensor histidine kinase [Pseudoduganella sp. SL102]WBS05270.1 PAS domain-containing protein [Pseudoduganella sp. SL102]